MFIKQHKILHFSVLLFFIIGISLNVKAQSIRDMVNTHVDDSLKKEQEKADKKKEEKKKEEKKKKETSTSPPKETAPSKETTKENKKPVTKKELPKGEQQNGITFSISTDSAKKDVHPEEKLPKRVLHKYFQLDPLAGIGYRGWVPQDYPEIETKVASYFTWQVELKGRFFNLFNLKRGYYESNGLASPRQPYKSNAAKYGSYAIKSAWFLAEFGIPIMKAWEPVIRYDTRAFSTTIKAKNGKNFCIVDYNGDPDAQFTCDNPGTKATMISAYESAVIGVTYYPSKNPSPVVEDKTGKKSPLFFGIGYLSYVKPYQVTIGSEVLEQLLFTGRFYGGGLAFGTKAGGGVNQLYLDVWAQLGLGASKIMKDLSLNDVAPSDWLIGYIQGNVALSFKWAPFKFAPTILIVPTVSASGSSFFFFETQKKEGEKFIMPNVNWDILYSARLSLVITL
ncbi:MAG: hypothetical protein JXR91_15900, partial [Deltaproteobacteria bacterium]|nr:hypothetical protein [Deltaproteobacteria bacterium]